MYKAIQTSSLQFLRLAQNAGRVKGWRKFSSQSSTIQPSNSIPNFGMEAQNEYRVGGFHPVELGDVFSARYRVLRKLGYGRYSTVWLFEDNQYFTVKPP
jgi:hypothetical protein